MTAPPTVLRFGRGVRAVHWAVAALVVVLVLTAAALYYGPLSLVIGHRHAVELVHVYAGLALPVPFLLGLLSRAFRADLGRLNRFTPADWRWLRSRTRRDGTIRVGKFNAGQKLNAAPAGGFLVVLLGTGVLMYFTGLVQLSQRTGATFMHDWFALGLGLLVLGHVWFALKDRHALSGMRTGRVPTTWARAEHAAWAAELADDPGDPPAATMRDVDTGAAAQAQLRTIGWLHSVFEDRGIDYWLFGGWAVDFHAGRITRDHADVDMAVWAADLDRIGTLLEAAGWARASAPDDDGCTAYERAGTRLELAFLARDDAGVVHTPLEEGRGDWPAGSFGDETGQVDGVTAHVVGLTSLVEDKSGPRLDPAAAAKDQADVTVLGSVRPPAERHP
jgi:formate dehydrogenase subunit gamma